MTIQVSKPRVMSGEELANDLRRISGAEHVNISLSYSTKDQSYQFVTFFNARNEPETRICSSIAEMYKFARSRRTDERNLRA